MTFVTIFMEGCFILKVTSLFNTTSSLSSYRNKCCAAENRAAFMSDERVPYRPLSSLISKSFSFSQ